MRRSIKFARRLCRALPTAARQVGGGSPPLPFFRVLVLAVLIGYGVLRLPFRWSDSDGSFLPFSSCILRFLLFS